MVGSYFVIFSMLFITFQVLLLSFALFVLPFNPINIGKSEDKTGLSSAVDPYTSSVGKLPVSH